MQDALGELGLMKGTERTTSGNLGLSQEWRGISPLRRLDTSASVDVSYTPHLSVRTSLSHSPYPRRALSLHISLSLSIFPSLSLSLSLSLFLSLARSPSVLDPVPEAGHSCVGQRRPPQGQGTGQVRSGEPGPPRKGVTQQARSTIKGSLASGDIQCPSAVDLFRSLHTYQLLHPLEL